MLEAILDTVVVHHLLRGFRPKKDRKSKPRATTALQDIELKLRRKRFRVVADNGSGLVSEWHRTCGEENVKQLVIKWSEFDGIKLVQPRTAIEPRRIASMLRNLGFRDAVDKLIVRTALANGARTLIVSIDSDFWDPSTTGRVGDATAPVAYALRTHLRLSVVITETFLGAIRAA